MRITRWQDYLVVVLGIWIAASPWTLGFSEVSEWGTWNAAIVGAVIAVLAASDLEAVSKVEEWAMVVLGAWAMVSPWVFGLAASQAATLSLVVSGLAVIVFSAWELAANRGWRKPPDHAHGQ